MTTWNDADARRWQETADHWMRLAEERAARIEELEALLSEAEFCTGCNGGEWSWMRRAEEAETRIAAAERALDDEEANLADDGARLSHSVVRRLRAALTVAGDDQPAEPCSNCGKAMRDHGSLANCFPEAAPGVRAYWDDRCPRCNRPWPCATAAAIEAALASRPGRTETTPA